MSKTKKKPTKSLKTTVEIVDWEDHWASGGGWRDYDLSHEPVIVKSAGIKVYEDKKVLQLSHMIDPYGSHGAVITILKKCIVKRRSI